MSKIRPFLDQNQLKNTFLGRKNVKKQLVRAVRALESDLEATGIAPDY